MYEARQNKEKPRRTIDDSRKKHVTLAYSHPNYKNSINNTSHLLQLRTEIEYETTSLEFTLPTGESRQEIVGKNMYALLDPEDPVKGSEPGSYVQLDLMNYLKGLNCRSMVRGHLLNAELGGLGIAANLYPITTQANSLHKNKVENHVKNELLKPIYTQDNRLKYKVVAEENEKFPNVTFECHYGKEKSSKWDYSCNINSYPEIDSTGYGETNWDAPSLSFLNKELPQGWGHTGRGYYESLPDHEKTIDRTSIDGYEGWAALSSIELNDVNYNTGELSFEGYKQFICDCFYDYYEYDEDIYETFYEQIESIEHDDFDSLYKIRDSYNLFE